MTVSPATEAGLSPWREVLDRVAAGDRFAGLLALAPGAPASSDADNSNKRGLSAHLARPGGVDVIDVPLPPGATSYPALTPDLNAAFWYERVIADQTGITPEGHPRPAPLVRPGNPGDHFLPRHVDGYGLFTIPHGPVRSGIVESMEYLVETPGEAIPHLNMRIFYKHRAVAARFEGRSADDGVLLAERAEGTAAVAHALAYCHAVEAVAGLEVPRAAALVRVIHAELERIANHLDVAVRLADAAGLAVATARFAVHKERVMRLVGAACGSRFGRGVVVPGGVSAVPRVEEVQLAALEKAVTADAEALMATSSFLDRLRGTGPLTPERAREHGALGPVGKASGYDDDARAARPYDAYPQLLARAGGPPEPRQHRDGDALARLRVRWDEVARAFELVRLAATELATEQCDHSSERIVAPAQRPPTAIGGRAVGWAEAPQGEVLYDVTVDGGRIERCQPRSASFHNLVLMHEVFKGDILTDFPFIEASFGLSVAGAAL
ncbi:MAG: NADH-quinone oxidoreductase subunit C [Nocardiopsaceae bacterium]|nr:NADH-quinone oxidoreductase subunit C [Nocardiopsaceae bacterium]